MRLVRFLVSVVIAAAAAGCAGVPAPVVAPPPAADLDSLMYGGKAAFVAAEPAVLPAPAAVLPVPAAVLPGPAPGGALPYTLDSSDRLRVVVFGQDGLSNTYIVDASGKITLPLIGAVSARGCTTTQRSPRAGRGGFQRRAAPPRNSLKPSPIGCATAMSASRMWRLKWRHIGP